MLLNFKNLAQKLWSIEYDGEEDYWKDVVDESLVVGAGIVGHHAVLHWTVDCNVPAGEARM